MSRALVNYASSSTDSSSESNPDANSPPPAKRTRKQQTANRLPSAISLLGGKVSREDNEYDNPAAHDGRIRCIKHERGNWATFVYAPVYSPELDQLQLLGSKVEITDEVTMQLCSDFHISLSRTVIIPHHQIVPFQQELRKKLSAMQKFEIAFGNLSVYTNDQKTRTFVAFKIPEEYKQELLFLVVRINAAMQDFNLEKFYPDCSFHVSFLWCVGDHEAIVRLHMVRIEELISRLEIQPTPISVHKIMCKTGNKFFEYTLQ